MASSPSLPDNLKHTTETGGRHQKETAPSTPCALVLRGVWSGCQEECGPGVSSCPSSNSSEALAVPGAQTLDGCSPGLCLLAGKSRQREEKREAKLRAEKLLVGGHRLTLPSPKGTSPRTWALYTGTT